MDNNLVVPKINNTYDCYRNICTSSSQAWYNRNLPDYGETYDDSLDSLWQIEYCKESDIPEIISKFDKNELLEYCNNKIKRFNDRYGNCFGEEWLDKQISLYVKVKESL